MENDLYKIADLHQSGPGRILLGIIKYKARIYSNVIEIKQVRMKKVKSANNIKIAICKS